MLTFRKNFHTMTEADTVTDTATNRRLFIGGLFPEITEDELRQRFKTFGNVSSVEIKIRKDYNGTPLKTFAYVDIETNDADFKKLMNSYNKTKWRGSELKIQKAKENFLLRLEQERRQQKEELQNPHNEMNKKLKPSTDVQNKLTDIAGVDSVANMKPDGAKPGSTIPGHKDWIVGKYGRVLPIVQMKKNYMTKPMKIDPSKYTHTVKKLKETDDRTKSCVNLTWQLEERENEITRKRKGEFPAWKPEKKRCADFDEIQQKLQEIISRHMVEGDMAEMEVVPVAGIGEANKTSTTNTKNVLVTKQAGLEQFDSDSDSDEDRTQAGYRGDAYLDLSRFDSDDDDDDDDGGSKPYVVLSDKTKPLPNNRVDLPKNTNKDRTESISTLKTVGSMVSKVADSKPDPKQIKVLTKTKANPKLIEGKKKLTEFRGLKFMSTDVPVKTDIKPVKEVEKAPVIVFDIDDDKNVPGKSQNKRVYNSSDEDDDSNRASVSSKIVASKKPKTNFSVSKTFASQYSFTNEFASGLIEGVDNVESVTNRFGDNDSDDDDDDNDDSDFESLVQKEMSKMNSSKNKTRSETRGGPPSLSISNNENKTVSKVKDTKSMTTPESVKHSQTVLREGDKTVSKSIENVVGSHKGGNVKVSATIAGGNKVVVDNGENDSSSGDDESDENTSDKNVANINVKGDDDNDDDDDDASDDEDTDEDDDGSGESDESDSDDGESNSESQNNNNVKTDIPIPGEIVDDNSDDDDEGDDDSGSENEETSKAKNSAVNVDDKDDDDDDDSSDSESEDEKEVVIKKQDNTAIKNPGTIPTAKTQKEDENSDASESDDDDDDDDDDSDDDDSIDDSNDGNESDASSNFEQTIRKALNGTKSIAQPFIKITTPKDENKSKIDEKENTKASELKGEVVIGNESSNEDSDDSSDSEAENTPDIVTDKQKHVEVAEHVLDDTDSSESEDDDSESGEDNIVVDVDKKEATKSGTNMNKDSKDDSESSETDSDSDDDDSDDDEIQIKSKTVLKGANNDELVKNDDSDSSESDSETDDIDDDGDGDKQVKTETVKNPVVTQKSNLRMTQTLNKIERKQAVQINNRNTSQKPDNMSGNFRQTGKIFEQTENKDDTDRKRLEAVKLRQQETKAQQSLIQTALANIDKGAPANNKIVFDSDSENDTVAMETDTVTMDTQGVKQNTDSADILAKLGFETGSKGKSLFDSSDDSDSDDDDGDRFKIRKEFEGTGGKKLATLQSRYGNDERFKLDSRFIESDSEEEVPEIEIEDETQRSLKILQSVVGVKAMRGVSKMDKAKKQFKDIGTLKYDPTKQEHQQQFEIKTAPKEQPIQEPKSKKKKKKKDLPVEEVPEVELPEVSKDKFYEVSDSLKNTFIEKAQTDTQNEAQTGTGFSLLSTFGKNQSGDKSQNEAQSGGGFSLLSMFGRHTSDDEKSDNEAVAIPIPRTLRTNQMSLDNRFKVVDDSDDDDDDSGVDNQRSTDDEKSTAIKNKQEITEKTAAMTTTVSKPSTFFFLPDDVRLKDTAKTSEPADTDKKSWFEKRRHLIDSYKSKYNNYKRKHKDDKKHGGGSRRGRGGRRR